MQKILSAVCLALFIVLSNLQPLFAVEPNSADYMCTPIFTGNNSTPNIAFLLDNGMEMQQAAWHEDFDNAIDFSPESLPASQVEYDGIGNGFYFAGGYATVDNRGSACNNRTGHEDCYLVQVAASLDLSDIDVTDAIPMDLGSGANLITDGNQTIETATWTINGRTIALALTSADGGVGAGEDDYGVNDRAGSFLYSANYLNWLFFYDTAADLDGDGDNEILYDPATSGELEGVSFLYHAKKAILAVYHEYEDEANIALYRFNSGNVDGAKQSQPFADAQGFENNVNNLQSTEQSALAEGLATLGEVYKDINAKYVTGVCQDQFVLVISPGISSYDTDTGSDNSYEPAAVTFDHDSDGTDCDLDSNPACSSSLTVDGVSYDIPLNVEGSTYFDDVAYYLATNNILDADGDGNADTPVYTYTVSLASKEAARRFLINGSNNGNGNANLTTSNDPYGKYHFDADTPEDLADALRSAINAMLERSASATSVSVLATSGEGEGIVVQAYFRQSEESGGAADADVLWVGHMHALWVDSLGNMREDTDQDHALDVTADHIVTYALDSDSGDTMIKRFAVSALAPYPDVDVECTDAEILAKTCAYEEVSLADIAPVWAAGTNLAARSAADRKIFTYLDYDQDETVDGSATAWNTGSTSPDPDPFDSYIGGGDLISFEINNQNWFAIAPFLGVKANDWDYLDTIGDLTPTHEERVSNLINYIRGTDIDGLRSRTINGNVWKLGDIIHSTPVTISAPPDRYHVIYSDESYQDYYDAFKDRETMVYVGANDGMLHAFTSWDYNENTQSFSIPTVAAITENIGDELWAYIPQALLPHLKWLPENSYQHMYYVDQKPKVFDAKILADGTHYVDGDGDDNWGTFLMLGLNLGGQSIDVTDQFDKRKDPLLTASTTRTYVSGYALLDITDPRNPNLLWERTYEDLQATVAFPSIVKVDDSWFAVFGSGPDDYCAGNSSQPGNVYVVDLKTGEPHKNGGNDWLFQTTYDNAFFNSPVSLDMKVNYNVDAVYMATSYYDDATPAFDDPDLWKGKLHKVTIPWKDGSGDYDGDNIASDVTNYSEDPNDFTNPWTFHTLLELDSPITASASLSLDQWDNVWIYAGTGRYLNEYDKDSSQDQYIFGIKDPFYNYQLSQDNSDPLNPYPNPLDKYYDNTVAPYNVENYHNYTNAGAFGSLSFSNLFYANPYTITTDQGMVDDDNIGTAATISSWDDLINETRNLDDNNADYWHGWYRELSTSKERVLQKASILGGTLFVPSFVPSTVVCGYGGDSYLYGLYYETGTAYYNPVLRLDTANTTLVGSTTYEVSEFKISLGEGKSSSLGIHVGMEEGATSFIQLSTGVVETESLTPALKIKSGFTSWKHGDDD